VREWRRANCVLRFRMRRGLLRGGRYFSAMGVVD
jgi:hypothetical protein